MKPGTKDPKRKNLGRSHFGSVSLFYFLIFLSFSSVSLSQARTSPRQFESEMESSSLNSFWRWIMSWIKAYCKLIWNWAEASLIQLKERTVFPSFTERKFQLGNWLPPDPGKSFTCLPCDSNLPVSFSFVNDCL